MNPWAEPGRKEFSDGNSRASSDVHLKILFYQLRWTWILSLKKKSSFWRRKTALACLIKSHPGKEINKNIALRAGLKVFLLPGGWELMGVMGIMGAMGWELEQMRFWIRFKNYRKRNISVI